MAKAATVKNTAKNAPVKAATAPKATPAKAAPVKAPAPKAEAPKVETPKVEAPSTTAPKVEFFDDFDMEALRRSRIRATAGVSDLATEIEAIVPGIGNMEVGKVAGVHIPAEYQFNTKNDEGNKEGLTMRGFMMNIRAKLNHLTPAGGQWEGRQFKVDTDPIKKMIFIQRGLDTDTPPVRKRAGGRPRKPNPEMKVVSAVTLEEGALVKEG